MALCKNCFIGGIKRDSLCQSCIDSGIIKPTKPKICVSCKERKPISLGRCSKCYQYYRANGADRVPGQGRQRRPSGPKCMICGIPNIVTKNRCSSCYQHLAKYGSDLDSKTARKRAKKRMKKVMVCVACKKPQVVAKSRCNSCYPYYAKHGRDRPPERIEALQAMRNPARACSVCGRPKVSSGGRCPACYQHYKKRGADRTAEETRAFLERLKPDKKCVACGRPKVVSKERCSSCYQYYVKNNKDRPPERIQELLNRSGPKAPCSNCKVRPASTKGRCPSCYQYFNLRGVDRDPERIRRKTLPENRPAKESCINGCKLEPKSWAESLWTKPYYGSRPKLTTAIKKKQKAVDSGWLCTVHHDRWKKHPCVQKRSGDHDGVPVYSKGPWICRGRALSGDAACPNMPLKMARTNTGELDYGNSEPDEMAVFFDGLCTECRSAEQDVLYEQAAEMFNVADPSQDLMKEALRHMRDGTRPELQEAAKPQEPLNDADVLKWCQEKAQIFQREDVLEMVLYDYRRWGPEESEEDLRRRFGQMIEDAKESDAQQPGNKIKEWNVHMDDRDILIPLLKIGKKVCVMEEKSGREADVVDAALDEMKRWGKYAGIDQYRRELKKLLPEFEASYSDEEAMVDETEEEEESSITVESVKGEWGPTMDDY